MAAKRHDIYFSLSRSLEAGLPVLRALELTAQVARGSFRLALIAMRDAAAAGENLAVAMAKRPDVFSPLEVIAIESAETAGHLPEAFEKLAQYYAFRDQLRRTALSGLTLPIVILTIAAFVIPVPQLFWEQVSPAGYFLRVLIPLSFFFVPALAILAIVRYTPETGSLRSLVDSVTLLVPILGRGVRQLSLSRFARTFQMLHSTGDVPIAECVARAADAAGNSLVRRWLIGGAKTALEGKPVSEGFSSALPPEFVAAWQVGEESGKLDEAVTRLADNAAQDADVLFTRLAVWLPRIVYFLVSTYLVVMIMRGWMSYVGQYNEVLNQ